MSVVAKEVGVASWSLEERLQETFNRALPKLGPEARAQIEAMMNPTSLAIIAGVLVAWVVSHAIGLGQLIDIIIIFGGVVAIGSAVFVGLDYLYDFAIGVYRAKTTADLEVAADKLAKAISILGIQAVLAILFRGTKAPRTGRGRHIPIGSPPPRTPGMRYKPKVRRDPKLEAGAGETTFWGDIWISTKGSANDRAMALLHESVHRFLAPKLYLLREYRVNNRASSYVRSSLWRYIEEALAETVARVGILGMQKLFSGIQFPVKQGYMYLRKGGGSWSSEFGGRGLIPETAGLLHRGIVHGIAFELWFSPVKTKD